MITIDNSKCIVCKQCVKECPHLLLKEKDGKICMTAPKSCIQCGHCIAVCPTLAISMTGYDMTQIEPIKKGKEHIDPDILLNAMKSRRSIRRFTKEKPTDDQIEKIIEAARFAPTGANRQGKRFFVFSDDTRKITSYTLKTLERILEERPARVEPFYIEHYRKRWTEMNYEYHRLDIDRLFYHAPVIFVIAGNDRIDGALAAANAELMAYALGLGCCYIGFFEIAGRTSYIRDFLKLEDTQEVICCLAIGYPDVKYLNTVPRKEANIEYY